MLESTFTKYLTKRLREEGAVVVKIHGGGMGQAGVPDLYVASPRFTGWLELKTKRNKPSVIQTRKMGELIGTGHVAAFVVRGTGEGRNKNITTEMPDGTPVGDLVESEALLPQLASTAEYCPIWWNATTSG